MLVFTESVFFDFDVDLASTLVTPLDVTKALESVGLPNIELVNKLLPKVDGTVVSTVALISLSLALVVVGLEITGADAEEVIDPIIN